MEKFKVYLDDERETPPGWVRAYWPEQAILMLQTGLVSVISLDHDLGDDTRGTGYDVLLWIEEQVFTENFRPPAIGIHTANPPARSRMQGSLLRILSEVSRQKSEGIEENFVGHR